MPRRQYRACDLAVHLAGIPTRALSQRHQEPSQHVLAIRAALTRPGLRLQALRYLMEVLINRRVKCNPTSSASPAPLDPEPTRRGRGDRERAGGAVLGEPACNLAPPQGARARRIGRARPGGSVAAEPATGRPA